MEHIASTFRVEEYPKQNTSKKQKTSRAIAYCLLFPGFLLVSFIDLVAVDDVPRNVGLFVMYATLNPKGRTLYMLH